MSFNGNVICAPKDFTLLTINDVTALRADNRGAYGLDLIATVDATKPASQDARAGSVYLAAGNVLAADLTLAQLWPGVAGAARVWAYNPGPADVLVSVSHA